MAAPTLLFDLDGTLADSHAWYAAVIAAECEVPEAEVRAQIAAGRPAITLAPDLGVLRSRFLRALRQTRIPLQPYTAVSETIGILLQRPTSLGLVTSLSPSVVPIVLNQMGLDNSFSAIVGAHRSLQRKPHPAPLLRCLELLGVRPSPEIYYVGDHVNDGKAAAAAGISFAWAKFGYTHCPPDDPEVVLERFADVLSL